MAAIFDVIQQDFLSCVILFVTETLQLFCDSFLDYSGTIILFFFSFFLPFYFANSAHRALQGYICLLTWELALSWFPHEKAFEILG